MKYNEVYTKSFLKDIKLIKKDRVLIERIHKNQDLLDICNKYITL